MAAALETPIEFDPTAGWSGDCGLVDIISPDSFVHVLSFTDHHTRAVWTELVCKSFRALRGEPRSGPRCASPTRRAAGTSQKTSASLARGSARRSTGPTSSPRRRRASLRST